MTKRRLGGQAAQRLSRAPEVASGSQPSLLSHCQPHFPSARLSGFSVSISLCPDRLHWHLSAVFAPHQGGFPALPPERHPQRPGEPTQPLPELPQQQGAICSCGASGASSPLAHCHHPLWLPTATQPRRQPSQGREPGGSAQTATPSLVMLHLKQPYKISSLHTQISKYISKRIYFWIYDIYLL